MWAFDFNRGQTEEVLDKISFKTPSGSPQLGFDKNNSLRVFGPQIKGFSAGCDILYEDPI
jgi:hypothetical protein